MTRWKVYFGESLDERCARITDPEISHAEYFRVLELNVSAEDPTFRIRKPYEPSPRFGSPNVDRTTGEIMPSLTRQEFKEETDVNTIVRNWSTRQPDVQASSASFGDFVGFEDYHSALNRVKAAQEAFEGLPVRARNAARNDPGLFLEMLMNPDTSDEMLEELGVKRGTVDQVEPSGSEEPSGETPSSPDPDPEPS